MKKMTLILLVLMTSLLGCNNARNSIQLLTSNEWQLESMSQNGTVLENPAKMPSIAFSDTATMSGFASCNRFFGKYKADKEGSLRLELGGTTMMACPDMRFEDSFLKALDKVNRFAIKDGRLVLTGEKLEMVYRKHASEE